MPMQNEQKRKKFDVTLGIILFSHVIAFHSIRFLTSKLIDLLLLVRNCNVSFSFVLQAIDKLKSVRINQIIELGKKYWERKPSFCLAFVDLFPQANLRSFCIQST